MISFKTSTTIKTIYFYPLTLFESLYHNWWLIKANSKCTVNFYFWSKLVKTVTKINNEYFSVLGQNIFTKSNSNTTFKCDYTATCVYPLFNPSFLAERAKVETAKKTNTTTQRIDRSFKSNLFFILYHLLR